MPQFTASQNTSSQTKKREPHRTHLRQNTAMKQAQPYKAAREDKVKAPPPRLTLVTKTDNPYQAQQKSANIEENTKKPRENRQKHSQVCANNRNKTQQSVKKKAKIAAQQRKKRIKTTTCNTQFTARLVGSAAQNRKRNPPGQQTKTTAVRSTSGTTEQTKTDANKNIVRQSQHASAPAVARSCSARRQDTPSNS